MPVLRFSSISFHFILSGESFYYLSPCITAGCVRLYRTVCSNRARCTGGGLPGNCNACWVVDGLIVVDSSPGFAALAAAVSSYTTEWAVGRWAVCLHFRSLVRRRIWYCCVSGAKNIPALSDQSEFLKGLNGEVSLDRTLSLPWRFLTNHCLSPQHGTMGAQLNLKQLNLSFNSLIITTYRTFVWHFVFLSTPRLL